MIQRTSRGRFAASMTAAVCAAAPGILKAAPLLLDAKCGSGTIPSTHTIAIRLNQALRAIEQETDGAIKVQLFTDDSLGSSNSQLTQLRTGAIQFFINSGLGLSSLSPLCTIEGAGFAFKNSQEGFRAYDGALGRRVRQDILKSGVVPVGRNWASGSLQLTVWPRPVRTPDDLSGLKVRVTTDRSLIDLFNTLGASAVPVPGAEAYTAAQTHLVDAISSTLQVFDGQKYYEVEKYLSLTAHAWSTYFLLANTDVWRALPDNLKTVFTRNIDKYALLQRVDSDATDANLVTKLQQHGLIVNQADPKPFRARLGPYYARQRDLYGADAWAMLESVTGRLG